MPRACAAYRAASCLALRCVPWLAQAARSATIAMLQVPRSIPEKEERWQGERVIRRRTSVVVARPQRPEGTTAGRPSLR